MSCDWFYGANPYDLNKTTNGGFVYAKASPRMVAMYAARAAYPGAHEHFVFDQVKHLLAARNGVQAQFIDTAYLSGFCQLSKDFYWVCTVRCTATASSSSRPSSRSSPKCSTSGSSSGAGRAFR
jgi:hypothetical protein